MSNRLEHSADETESHERLEAAVTAETLPPPVAQIVEDATDAEIEKPGTVEVANPHELVLDKSIQPRQGTSPDIEERYASLMKKGITFPRPIVIQLEGKFIVVDGTHRVRAARAAELTEIEVEVREFTPRQAQEYALLANNRHGLSLTPKEKRSAVDRMLRDPIWCKWADSRISRYCGVSSRTVGRLREQLEQEGQTSTDASKPVTRIREYKKNGKTLTMDTSRQGRRKQASSNSEPTTEDSNGDSTGVPVAHVVTPAARPPGYADAKGQTTVQASGTATRSLVLTDKEVRNGLVMLSDLLKMLLQCAEAAESLSVLIERATDPAIKVQAIHTALVLTTLVQTLKETTDDKPAPPATKQKSKRRSLWDSLPESTSANPPGQSVGNLTISAAASSMPAPSPAC